MALRKNKPLLLDSRRLKPVNCVVNRLRKLREAQGLPLTEARVVIDDGGTTTTTCDRTRPTAN